jgi:hypothetical protein
MIERFLKWTVRTLLARAPENNAYDPTPPSIQEKTRGERDEAERDEAERDERAERDGHVEGN